MIILRTALALAASSALLAAPLSSAFADKDKSVEIYKSAKKKYNLGEFEAAIALFKEAYDEFEAPAYLYNIAQAYRQLGNCKKSLFFYERFLAEKPGSDQEATIKGYVAELESECGEESSDAKMITEVDDPIKKPPPPAPELGETGAVPASTVSAKTSGGAVTAGPITDEPRGPLVVASAEVGLALFQMGEVSTPVAPTLRIGAAYPVLEGALRVDVGVNLLLSTMSYREAMGDSSVLFSSYLLNAGASYGLSEVLRIGGDVGVGLFRFAGVESGNPFTAGSSAQDAHTSVALRLGASAQYALSEDMLLSLSPAFSYAGAHDELASDIGAVTNLQILTGVRYRW